VVQYRKSKKVGPIRLTASKSGISASVGYGPFRVTRRADGRYQRTARLPSTGMERQGMFKVRRRNCQHWPRYWLRQH
jgi:hypothetical protein